MTAEPRSVAAYYDRAAALVPELTVLNYGYDDEPEHLAISSAERDYYSLRLYEHTTRRTQLENADVLEISCGRGGGASYLCRTRLPKRYVGLDLSEENLRLAAARHGGPAFMLGNAESLPIADAAFDVVINIEASHLYPDRRRFFAEVFRALRPGGVFCYADGCWANDDCSVDLLAAGFALDERLDITANVISALEKDSARRAALFDAMTTDEALRREYKDWGGVIGYRAHRRFTSRETLYFSHLLTKPRT